VELTLLIPSRNQSSTEGIFTHYHIAKTFEIKQLYAPDFNSPSPLTRLAFHLKNIISALKLVRYALANQYDFIYSRDEWPLYFLSFFRNNLIFEVHKYSSIRKIFYRRFIKANIGVICISNGLKNKFANLGFKTDNLVTIRDAVNPEEFAINISMTEARNHVKLPLDKKIVVYSGQLFEWKGVANLIIAAQDLPLDVLVVVVGGGDEEIARLVLLDRNGRVEFIGWRKHSLIPLYLRAADLLVLPNKKDGDLSEFYTSPLKMFEYMAAGKPIIATDLPSLREVLNEQNAFFVVPGDSVALARGITMVLNNAMLADRISRQALQEVKNYTWDIRAQQILDFIK